MSYAIKVFSLITITFAWIANAQVVLYDNADLPVPRGQRLTHPDEAWLFAQPFRTGDASMTVTSVSIPFARTGNPTGEIHLSIWDNENGLPGELVDELGVINDLGSLPEFAPSLTALSSLTFEGPAAQLSPNSTYFVYMDFTEVDSTSITSSTFPLNNIVNGTPTTTAGTNGAGSLLSTDRGTTNWFDVSEKTGRRMYLQMSIEATDSSLVCMFGGDFDDDNDCDLADIDLLGSAIANNQYTDALDLTNDGNLDQSDVEAFLGEANRLTGDANFDGAVTFSDFLTLSARFGASDKKWSEGDFIVNGEVDFEDFLALSANFGQSTLGAASVPEPSNSLLMVLGCLGLCFFRMKRIDNTTCVGS